jgi:hypothetical protein
VAHFPPYSERFVSVTDALGWRYYTVPGGMRAIVRSVTASNDTSSSGLFYVLVADTIVFKRQVQEPDKLSVSQDMRHVAYAGERLGAYSNIVNGHVMVSGYLLTEVPGGGGGESSYPGPAPPGWREEPVPLPSAAKRD